MTTGKSVSIWFFIGISLLINGVLILEISNEGTAALLRFDGRLRFFRLRRFHFLSSS